MLEAAALRASRLEGGEARLTTLFFPLVGGSWWGLRLREHPPPCGAVTTLVEEGGWRVPWCVCGVAGCAPCASVPFVVFVGSARTAATISLSWLNSISLIDTTNCFSTYVCMVIVNT